MLGELLGGEFCVKPKRLCIFQEQNCGARKIKSDSTTMGN